MMSPSNQGTKYIMPVAIDLGACNTGVWSSLYGARTQAGDPAASPKGYTLTVNKKALTLMMPQRTAMRHARRGYKRRRLAKLLVRLWLADRWPAAETDADRLKNEDSMRFIAGLMNRRGFTHFTLDEKIDADAIDGPAEQLEAVGLPLGSLKPSEWLLQVAADPKQAETYLHRKLFTLVDSKGGKGRAASLLLTTFVEAELAKAGTSSDEIKDTCKGTVAAINKLRRYLEEARDARGSSRTEYLKAIRTDIERTARGQSTCRALDMKANELTNLIGHIGNLNLRALRRYFHDDTKAARANLDVERFARAWRGFFDGWTFTGETGQRKDEIRVHHHQWCARVRQSVTKDQVWELLTRFDPAETIPPFEAQVNRRTPTCQSLLLDPDALDKEAPCAPGSPVPNWRIWAQKLESHDAALGEDLDVIAAVDAGAVNRHVVKADRDAEAKRHRAARLLQRVLDRSKDLDPFKLKSLTAEHHSVAHPSAMEAKASLRWALGEQHVEAFLDFARRYFRESRTARDGFWSQDKQGHGLLTTCGTHPPQKGKVQVTLVGNVLAAELGDTAMAAIKSTIETEALQPPSTLSGRHRRNPRRIATCLADFAKLQKKMHGDLGRLHGLAQSETQEARRTWGAKDEKAQAWNAYCWAEVIAARLGEVLGHTPQQSARYSTPYSLAQLHQILYEDRGGFASTCRACLKENGWRARLDADGKAKAQRLPADSVRPFDGMLARMLRAEAHRIANAVVADFPIPADAGSLVVPIVVEDNRFEFTEQFASLKGVPDGKLKALQTAGKQRRKEWSDEWKDKWERITTSGHGLCPYCGGAINGHGDFDHIASRADTHDAVGYAFDSEANLIYAHPACNAKKGRSAYTLDNVHSAYLTAAFGHANRATITQKVEADCEGWLADRTSKRAFHQLDPSLRRAIRHALFVPELRGRVLKKIANQNVTRVNGTQRWFARELASAIGKALTRAGVTLQPEFSLRRIKYQDVGELRQRLAKVAKDRFEKPEVQPAYSHVVDAALVFAIATTDAKGRAELGLSSGSEAEITEFVEPDRAAALLPRSLRIIAVERRPKYAPGVKPWHQPLFKSKPIGERFVPVGVDSERHVWVGFSTGNRIELTAPKATARGASSDPRINFLRALWPVLRHPEQLPDVDMDALASLAGPRHDGVLWLKVDKRRAFEHMLAKRRGDDTTAAALRSLLYQVQHVNVAVALNLDKGKPAPTADALLDAKHFTINVGFPGILKLKAGTQKLTLPAKAAWERLCADSALQPHLGTAKLVTVGSKEDLANGEAAAEVAAAPRATVGTQEGPSKGKQVVLDWDALVKKHFLSRKPNDESNDKPEALHRRHRQVNALPRVVAASGGIRVRRRDPQGRPVFQLLQHDHGLYGGFEATKAFPGFNSQNPQLLPVFVGSRNLTPLDTKHRSKVDVVGFDEPTTLPSGQLSAFDVSGIELIPHSADRRAIRMTISWEGLGKMLPDLPTLPYTHQGATIEVSSDQAHHIAAVLMQSCNNERVGPRIVGSRKAYLRIQEMSPDTVTLFWVGGEGPGGSDNTTRPQKQVKAEVAAEPAPDPSAAV